MIISPTVSDAVGAALYTARRRTGDRRPLLIQIVSHRAPFAAYLFDLDGTLIDSIALITSSFEHTLRTHQTTMPANETLRPGFGTPLRTQLPKGGA